MLEIFGLIFLSKKIGGIASDKGHSRGLFIALTIIAWVGCEIAGVLIGLIVFEDEGILMYGLGLLGAALGVLVVFVLASSIGENQKQSTDVLDEQFENEVV
ncbi:MAG: hypothetical protein ACI9J3_002286 [Parvicellaceae bacterium]|jgi:hypothetical protein